MAAELAKAVFCVLRLDLEGLVCGFKNLLC